MEGDGHRFHPGLHQLLSFRLEYRSQLWFPSKDANKKTRAQVSVQITWGRDLLSWNYCGTLVHLLSFVPVFCFRWMMHALKVHIQASIKKWKDVPTMFCLRVSGLEVLTSGREINPLGVLLKVNTLFKIRFTSLNYLSVVG